MDESSRKANRFQPSGPTHTPFRWFVQSQPAIQLFSFLTRAYTRPFIQLMQCPDCGAQYDSSEESCALRFDQLLALDHSRRDPWGLRHGLAFSVYALQHPSSFPPATLDRAWLVLYRVYVAGDSAIRLFKALSGRSLQVASDWEAPARPAMPAGCPAMTIADLGDFEAETYPAQLDSWALATVRWLMGLAASSEQGTAGE